MPTKPDLTVVIPMTRTQIQIIRMAAQAQGMDIADFMRKLAIDYALVKSAEAEGYED